jgi:hypothetical protein
VIEFPTITATTTKAIQPQIASLRCSALQCAARAAIPSVRDDSRAA